MTYLSFVNENISHSQFIKDIYLWRSMSVINKNIEGIYSFIVHKNSIVDEQFDFDNEYIFKRVGGIAQASCYNTSLYPSDALSLLTLLWKRELISGQTLKGCLAFISHFFLLMIHHNMKG